MKLWPPIVLACAVMNIGARRLANTETQMTQKQEKDKKGSFPRSWNNKQTPLPWIATRAEKGQARAQTCNPSVMAESAACSV